MDEFKLLKNNKVKGLCIYCTKCKIKVKNTCGISGKRISSCNDKDKHKYKLRVCIPGNDSAVKTKLFDTRDPNEVILQAFAYRAELEKCNYMPKIIGAKTDIPTTIMQAMAFYLAYLNNDTPHQQEHKHRSKGHIDEVERYFLYFGNYLKTIHIDPTLFPMDKLDRNVVGKLKSFLLETKNYAPRTYNKYIGLMRVFINYLMEEFDLQMKNPFKGFKRLHTETNINTITNQEFHSLLNVVTPENGVLVYEERKSKKKYKKILYKPWLKDAILLALLTGRRREEIVNLKFDGIMENAEGEPVTLSIEDFKVNRSNNLSEKEAVKLIYIPIISPLKKLLMELGYKENKGKDMYILAPDETMKRETMMDFISKAFSHYYGQLRTGKKLQFKDLRKTYISHLYAAHGEKARIITKHSGEDVMLNHYIDEKVIAQVAMDFELFDL